jgi:hypothetical protein
MKHERFGGVGQRSPATLLAIDERTVLLRQAAMFYPGLSQRETARLIRTALLRYQAGPWRRDRSEALCPSRYAGKLTAVLWMLLKTHDHTPSQATVRRALYS